MQRTGDGLRRIDEMSDEFTTRFNQDLFSE